MANYNFFTITADQALNVQSTDRFAFIQGEARDATVIYNGPQDDPTSISVTIAGHTVEFGAQIATDAFFISSQPMFLFSDARGPSTLVIGGAQGDEIDLANPLSDRFDTATSSAVFGGPGNDIIVGDGGPNLMQGNTGDDTLEGFEGSEVFYGGQGNDVIITNGSDDMNNGGDYAQGNKGDDTIDGDTGADTLLGGQGNDSIRGGGSDDYISGDRGDDTVTGGPGADTFHAFAGSGIDRVLDFNRAEGDRVLLDPGTTFHVDQIGADTVVTLDGGGEVVLVAVQASTLNGDWIVVG